MRNQVHAASNHFINKLFIWLTVLLIGNVLLQKVTAQDISSDASPVKSCSHGRVAQRPMQVDYYQYPSMNKYDMKYLFLDITVQPNSKFISGNAYLESQAVQTMDSLIFELLDGMIVDSVKINSINSSFSRGSNMLFVPLSSPVPAGSMIRSQVFYRGTADGSGVFSGITGSLSYTASLSESYQARTWFPIKQILTDKIDSAKIWITTNIGNKAGSNGILYDSVDVGGGKRQFRWKTHHPMNYYLPSFAVGNYQEYRNYAKPAAIAPDSILIQHYISPSSSYLNSNKTNIDKTPRFLEKFSELFGLYPFSDEKYGHCQASIGGGMEHQTMSTMQNFGSTLIAHELGHQWWGDRVTCAKWNDIWINEGFASYCEYLAIEKLPALFPTTTATAFMGGVHNTAMNTTGGSVYVPESSVYDEARIFSYQLSYCKGSAIVHNLRFEMGSDSLFLQALRDFQIEFDDSTATAEDFKRVAESVSGKNLDDFFQQWYYGQGYPTFNISYFNQGTDTLLILVEEVPSAPAVTAFFKGQLQLKIQSATGDTTITVQLAENNQAFRIPYSKIPTGLLVDPNNWMLNKTGLIFYGGAVPLKLTAFNVLASNDCNTKINWSSIGENPGVEFKIEASQDGRLFNTLMTIAGNGRSRTDYHQIITLPFANTNYIRIKMISADGQVQYSDIMAVQNNCAVQQTINIFPNPAENYIRVRWQAKEEGDYSFDMLDANGKLIARKSKRCSVGFQEIPFDLQSLPKGSYMIKAYSNNNVFGTSRFVRQ